MNVYIHNPSAKLRRLLWLSNIIKTLSNHYQTIYQLSNMADTFFFGETHEVRKDMWAFFLDCARGIWLLLCLETTVMNIFVFFGKYLPSQDLLLQLLMLILQPQCISWPSLSFFSILVLFLVSSAVILTKLILDVYILPLFLTWSCVCSAVWSNGRAISCWDQSLLSCQFSEYNSHPVRVYIHIRQLSSFRAPTLLFVDLTVATCHIHYSFLSLCQYFSRENGQNTKILDVRHFRMIGKWPPTATRRAKH